MSLLEKSSSVELSRRTHPFNSDQSSYVIGSANQIKIEVPLTREFLDPENSRLVFDYKVSDSTNGTDGTIRTNPWFASQIIRTLRLKTLAGSQIGHEVGEYRAWAQMYFELTGNSEMNNSYNSLLEKANPNNVVNGQVEQCAHKFLTHILGCKEYLPLHFCQGFVIEIDLPSNVNELLHVNGADVGSSVLGTLTLSNVRYICDLVQLRPEIENELVQMMEGQKLFLDYVNVNTDTQSALESSTNGAYECVGIDGRIKSVFSYEVVTTDRTQKTDGASSGEWYFSKYARNSLTSYRFKLGANYLNYGEIKVNEFKKAEQCMELLKALDLHWDRASRSMCGDASLGVDGSGDGDVNKSFEDARFVVAVKVDKSQLNVDDTISSEIDKDRNNLRKEYTKDSGAGAGTHYMHIVIDQRLQFLSGSVVRSVKS